MEHSTSIRPSHFPEPWDAPPLQLLSNCSNCFWTLLWGILHYFRGRYQHNTTSQNGKHTQQDHLVWSVRYRDKVHHYLCHMCSRAWNLNHSHVSQCQTYPPSLIPVGWFLLGAAICSWWWVFILCIPQRLQTRPSQSDFRTKTVLLVTLKIQQQNLFLKTVCKDG